MKCVHCNKRKKAYNNFTFKYDGLKFIARPFFECEICSKKNLIKLYEEFVKSKNLIRKKNLLIVNWHGQHELTQDFIDILLTLGIFTHAQEKVWAISGGGFLNLAKYNFTRKQDAMSYARFKFGGTRYYWQVKISMDR